MVRRMLVFCGTQYSLVLVTGYTWQLRSCRLVVSLRGTQYSPVLDTGYTSQLGSYRLVVSLLWINGISTLVCLVKLLLVPKIWYEAIPEIPSHTIPMWYDHLEWYDFRINIPYHMVLLGKADTIPFGMIVWNGMALESTYHTIWYECLEWIPYHMV